MWFRALEVSKEPGMNGSTKWNFILLGFVNVAKVKYYFLYINGKPASNITVKNPCSNLVT